MTQSYSPRSGTKEFPPTTNPDTCDEFDDEEEVMRHVVDKVLTGKWQLYAGLKGNHKQDEDYVKNIYSRDKRRERDLEQRGQTLKNWFSQFSNPEMFGRFQLLTYWHAGNPSIVTTDELDFRPSNQTSAPLLHLLWLLHDTLDWLVRKQAEDTAWDPDFHRLLDVNRWHITLGQIFSVIKMSYLP